MVVEDDFEENWAGTSDIVETGLWRCAGRTQRLTYMPAELAAIEVKKYSDVLAETEGGVVRGFKKVERLFM